MAEFTFREDRATQLGWVTPPDLVWQDGTRSAAAIGFADFVLSDGTDGPAGGLRSVSPLETAILIQLFTDARDDRPEATERRGWFGDAFDIDQRSGEAPLGSLLWTLERAALTPETGRMAENYARLALQPLIAQGLVQRFDVTHEIDAAAGMLALRVVAEGESGNIIFNRAFGVTGHV